MRSRSFLVTGGELVVDADLEISPGTLVIDQRQRVWRKPEYDQPWQVAGFGTMGDPSIPVAVFKGSE